MGGDPDKGSECEDSDSDSDNENEMTDRNYSLSQMMRQLIMMTFVMKASLY